MRIQAIDRNVGHPSGDRSVLLDRYENDRIVLIVGAARSGTTWLAKIFDSHPDVLYLHEPDDGFSGGETTAGKCRSLVASILQRRNLRTIGKTPLFPKAAEPSAIHHARAALMHGLRAASRLGAIGAKVSRIPVPEPIAFGPSRRGHLVVKSVSGRGFVRLFTQAVPGARVIVILRHPCGQAASILRGIAMRKFASACPLDDDFAAMFARAHGETRAWGAIPLIEQLAWNWASSVDRIFRDLAGYPHVRVVQHIDLCLRPIEQARSLFAFADLPWDPQTETFVRDSTRAGDHDRYYEVYRDSAKTPFEWRARLSPDEQAAIIAIARRSGYGRMVMDEPGLFAAAS
jgi:hypothetical protein